MQPGIFMDESKKTTPSDKDKKTTGFRASQIVVEVPVIHVLQTEPSVKLRYRTGYRVPR